MHETQKMKMIPHRLVLTIGLAALLMVVALYKMQAHYHAREVRMALGSTRLHERLFLELLRTELDRSLPHKAHVITASGGATESRGNFDFTTMNEVIFEESIPESDLTAVAESLSGNLEIATWVSLAIPSQNSRFCQFHVVEQSGKQYLRMLMHESSRPDGPADADLRHLFAGDYYQSRAAAR